MAIKRLRNGAAPRAFPPSPWRAEEELWARSVCADPSRAFVLLSLTTDLVFLTPQEQKKCVGWVVVAPHLLPGAEPERLLARFQSALRRAEARASRLGEHVCHLWQEGASAAAGQALGHVAVCPGYEMGRDFFGDRVDPRKARRAKRRPPRESAQAALSDELEDDPEWELAIEAIQSGLRESGFEVIEAPWITRDYAGALTQLGFRERVRAFLEDQRMGSELRGELPAPPSAGARAL